MNGYEKFTPKQHSLLYFQPASTRNGVNHENVLHDLREIG